MLEYAELTAILPHRHPILQIDRVLEVEPGRRIVAVKAVTGTEPCFAGLAEGLAPGAYGYPPALLVESLGQAGAALWVLSARAGGETLDGTLVFGAARDFRFVGAAYPGDVMRHEVVVESLKANSAVMRGETWVGDRRIAVVGSMLAVARPESELAAGPTG
ncbi:3-hydroxyacyl-ACP dehydratase FabZ family protein [Micromonospora sp. C28ISP2-4]|uniref:3-hydroxyacyl-ACP dehydratase FabZ family protein n=1 Tax=Micromonospora sp. C28ISP2-4 TaxID=3059523 RepID=UPI0026774E4C|nr:beta-hydroxyacyl-ACP dehydratase [Micromonospora sp. C28ISP2-4]MDO3686683.1 beta-hydroxyacyl-ACP dehydratase [Micromonospora sp. C28ISP2-4]